MNMVARTDAQAKNLKCSCCGQEHSTDFHFHHTVPATPGSDEYELWESAREFTSNQLRVLGPGDLLRMACGPNRRMEINSLNQGIQELQVGDNVKLCFLIKDKKALWMPADVRNMARQCASEGMIVEITEIDGKWPSLSFQGQLLNMPLLINPCEIQLGWRVRFTPDYIQSV